MVNEQLTQEAIRFCYRGSKEVIHLSEKSMVYIMKLYNATIKPAKDRIFKDPQDCHGKMSVKKWTFPRQNSGIFRRLPKDME